MNRLENKTAVITGGAGGIGRATASLFIAEGANVILADLNEVELQQACAEIGSNRISYVAGDVTSLADNKAMVRAAEERHGSLEIFVANAGIEGDVASIVDYDEHRFDQVLDINVKGPFLGLKAAIPAMEKSGGGSFIITSSVAGLQGAPNFSAYNTSKHAVIGLMKSAALECAPKGIRVNTVNPSQVETGMMRRIEEGIAPGEGEHIHQQMMGTIPMGRYAEAEDIARLMLFLASDDSSFITGSVNRVDGGLTA